MTTQTADTTVQTAITVDAPIERAFTVFTDDIGSCWTPEHHILQAPLAAKLKVGCCITRVRR